MHAVKREHTPVEIVRGKSKQKFTVGGKEIIQRIDSDTDGTFLIQEMKVEYTIERKNKRPSISIAPPPYGSYTKSESLPHVMELLTNYLTPLVEYLEHTKEENLARAIRPNLFSSRNGKEVYISKGECRQTFTVDGKKVQQRIYTEQQGCFVIEKMKINYVIDKKKEGNVLHIGTLEVPQNSNLQENHRNELIRLFVAPLIDHLVHEKNQNLVTAKHPHWLMDILRGHS